MRSIDSHNALADCIYSTWKGIALVARIPFEYYGINPCDLYTLPITEEQLEIEKFLSDLDLGHFEEGVDHWPLDIEIDEMVTEIVEGTMYTVASEKTTFTSEFVDDGTGFLQTQSENTNREIDNGKPWVKFEEYPEYEIRPYLGQLEIRKVGSKVRNRVWFDEFAIAEEAAYSWLWNGGAKEKVYHHKFAEKYNDGDDNE